MASGIRTVIGNCEQSLAAGGADCGCGFGEGTACDLLSRGWFAHAFRTVAPRHRAWMGALPERLVLRIAGRRLEHGLVGQEGENELCFMVWLTAAIALLSALAILREGLPALFVRPCA